jgi:ribosomal protein S18 acetylase RimI-like enzyme
VGTGEEVATFEIRRVTAMADVIAAAALFDEPIHADAASHFIARADHHLLVAYEGSQPVGMVTGAEITHPDKGTEMFINELGVSAEYRQRGIGRALVAALADRARERGCYGMWVCTERDNAAALATYDAAGGCAANEERYSQRRNHP